MSQNIMFRPKGLHEGKADTSLIGEFLSHHCSISFESTQLANSPPFQPIQVSAAPTPSLAWRGEKKPIRQF